MMLWQTSMMSGITDLAEMLSSLEPVLLDGEFVFVSVDAAGARSLDGFATVTEPEGTTVVLRKQQADDASLAYEFTARWITLTVNSSLEAIGLTAAFASALTDEGISCNVLAGFHHDHILVPAAQADRAMNTLRRLAADNQRSADGGGSRRP